MSHLRTVYIVDPDATSRRLLTAHLACVGAEAWPFARGAEFLHILDHLAPACVILDMNVAEPGGLELLAELVRRRPFWPVLAISGAPELETAVAAMKLGALDFLAKPLEPPALAAALAPAFGRLERALETSEARRRAGERLSRLSQREFDIALALIAGQSNKTVAHMFGISVRTVEMHRAHIMAKLQVKTLAEAAVLATQAGLESANTTVRPRAVVEVPPFLAGRPRGSFMELSRAERKRSASGGKGTVR